MNSEANPEIASLQKQFFGLLIALILVSGTLTYYFYGQVRLAHRSVTQDKQIIDLAATNAPIAKIFFSQLIAYGQTHPEFRPLLAKYGLNAPSGAPVAAAPAPKK